MHLKREVYNFESETAGKVTSDNNSSQTVTGIGIKKGVCVWGGEGSI